MRKNEIINIRAEINEIHPQKINESKSWSSEKINGIDRPLTRFTKKNREYPNKIRNERGEITTDTKEI